jgi:hypothetical protein
MLIEAEMDKVLKNSFLQKLPPLPDLLNKAVPWHKGWKLNLKITWQRN